MRPEAEERTCEDLIREKQEKQRQMMHLPKGRLSCNGSMADDSKYPSLSMNKQLLYFRLLQGGLQYLLFLIKIRNLVISQVLRVIEQNQRERDQRTYKTLSVSELLSSSSSRPRPASSSRRGRPSRFNIHRNQRSENDHLHIFGKCSYVLTEAVVFNFDPCAGSAVEHYWR